MGSPNILVGRCHFCFEYKLEEYLQEVELKNLPRDSRGKVYLCTGCMLKLRNGKSLIKGGK